MENDNKNGSNGFGPPPREQRPGRAKLGPQEHMLEKEAPSSSSSPAKGGPTSHMPHELLEQKLQDSIRPLAESQEERSAREVESSDQKRAAAAAVNKGIDHDNDDTQTGDEATAAALREEEEIAKRAEAGHGAGTQGASPPPLPPWLPTWERTGTKTAMSAGKVPVDEKKKSPATNPGMMREYQPPPPQSEFTKFIRRHIVAIVFWTFCTGVLIAGLVYTVNKRSDQGGASNAVPTNVATATPTSSFSLWPQPPSCKDGKVTQEWIDSRPWAKNRPAEENQLDNFVWLQAVHAEMSCVTDDILMLPGKNKGRFDISACRCR